MLKKNDKMLNYFIYYNKKEYLLNNNKQDIEKD